MCGIAGMAGNEVDSQKVEEMVTLLRHRGPDDTGYYHSNGLSFGQTRLAVIDLLTGHQPMSNEDKTIWIVYNGEVYNFIALRQELTRLGYRFRTQSDTEVLVHGYKAYGIDVFAKLDGIFAAAIWDDATQTLVLARDPLGVKPLHYWFNGNTLIFASEIKSVLLDQRVRREVDPQGLHLFLNLRYIPVSTTLFKKINRLLPGHVLIFSDNQLRCQPYFTWNISEQSQLSQTEYIDGIRYYLSAAVKKQLISDVPLGVYLSGGLDSSAIVAYMQHNGHEKIQSFSLGFNEPTDELDDASIVARFFNTEHHAKSLSPTPLQSFPKVIWHVEEPKENILQGYLLAAFARERVSVVLTGLGGDELFAGYINNRFLHPVRNVHRWVPSWMQQLIFSPLARIAFAAQNASGMLPWDIYRRGLQLMLAVGDEKKLYLILRNVWDYDRKAFSNIYGSSLLQHVFPRTEEAFSGFFSREIGDGLRQSLWAELNTKMIDDFLLNEDRTSMAHGLEARVPFLDKDLVQFAFSIPSAQHMQGNQTKFLFREAMRGILPESTINKKKWGFSFNPYYQFQKDLKTNAERILTRRVVEHRGWFNYDYIDKILKHPASPNLRWHYFYIWIVLGLEIWAKMFLEGDPSNPDFHIESYYD